MRQPALVDTVADVRRAQRVQELEQAVVAIPARVAVQSEYLGADVLPVRAGGLGDAFEPDQLGQRLAGQRLAELDINSRPSPTRSGVVKYQTLVLLADWLCRTRAPTVR